MKYSDDKQQLGQFFTTNSKDVLRDLLSFLSVSPDSVFIDPFAGNWDLLNSVPGGKVGYDICPQNTLTEQRDSLFNPLLNWEERQILITNPPYLARNKSISKDIYNRYGLSDLYLIFIEQLIQSNLTQGIIILPTAFLTNQRNKVMRDKFTSKYRILRAYIYEKPMFEDTTYSVCAFAFSSDTKMEHGECHYIPSGRSIRFTDSQKEVGESLLNYPNTRNVKRLLVGDTSGKTNIKINCIDNITTKISAEIAEPFFGISTDRAFLTLRIQEGVSSVAQQHIVSEFNRLLSIERDKSEDFILSNYRNNNRKRITFSQIYGLISYIMDNMEV